MRSLAVILFIGVVAATGGYFAQRRTLARGDVLAATLLTANPMLQALQCDREVPIGVTGATFSCRAEFKNGDRAQYTFAMDRDGRIGVAEHGETEVAPRIKRTSDPWGE